MNPKPDAKNHHKIETVSTGKREIYAGSCRIGLIKPKI